MPCILDKFSFFEQKNENKNYFNEYRSFRGGVYNVNIADFTQISVIHGKLAFSVNTNKLILSETFLYT